MVSLMYTSVQHKCMRLLYTMEHMMTCVDMVISTTLYVKLKQLACVLPLDGRFGCPVFYMNNMNPYSTETMCAYVYRTLLLWGVKGGNSKESLAT